MFVSDGQSSPVKWTFLHLIDPGIIGEDASNDKVFVIGYVAAIIGVILFSTLLFEFLYNQMKNIADGVIPRGIRNHLIVIGESEQLIPFAKESLEEFQKRYSSEIKEVLLIVTDSKAQEGLKRLKRIKNKKINVYAIDVEQIKEEAKLNLDRAKRIHLLSGFVGDAGSLVAFIRKVCDELPPLEPQETSVDNKINGD